MSADSVFNAAAQALNPAEAQRFSALVGRADSAGDGVIGMWMDDRQACMAGLVLAGRLIGWWMFSAPSESAAQGALVGYKRIIERALDERAAQAVFDADEAPADALASDGITRH